MATVNGVPFRQMLVSPSKHHIKAPYAMTPKKITIHNTDNQMPAENEIKYMNSNNNQTSYHLAIDEKEAIQGLPYNRNGWHSGDGGNGYGNRNTIGVEICRNYDRSRGTTNLNEPLASQYSKAEQNTIKFVAQLCIDLGIVANDDNIKTHNNWNGKWCPSKILNEGRLPQVKQAIIAEYNRLVGGDTMSRKPSEWAEKQWTWGVNNGLVTDNPRDNMTREQALTVLHNYHTMNNGGKPTDWAKESWEWAEKQGYMNGRNPRANISRQELAAVLKSFADRNNLK